MAKPRVFVSSTYYDLKHIRNAIEDFVIQMGYEPILFESGNIPFKHNLPLDISCYDEIQNSQMQVLIIGGRYGSPESDIGEEELKKLSENKMYEYYNSITKKEYETADENGIPIFVFVENGVLSEYNTYRLNKENDSIKYAHVDSINVFKLLDNIWLKKKGNFTKGFDKVEDITSWLKEQWAGLFFDFLLKEKNAFEIKRLQNQIKDLTIVSNTLKEYTEALMTTIKPEDYKNIITKEDDKIYKHRILSALTETYLIDHLRNHYSLNNSEDEIYDLVINNENINEFIKNASFGKDTGNEWPRGSDGYLEYERLQQALIRITENNV